MANSEIGTCRLIGRIATVYRSKKVSEILESRFERTYLEIEVVSTHVIRSNLSKRGRNTRFMIHLLPDSRSDDPRNLNRNERMSN